MCPGFWIHARRFSGVFAAAPDAIGVAAHQVRQIGSDGPLGRRAVRSCGSSCRLRFRKRAGPLPTATHPARPAVCWFFTQCANCPACPHKRGAASWRAPRRRTARTGRDKARLLRIDPHLVEVVRNQVGLAGKLRNPEAVIHVGREQRQIRGSGSAVVLTGTCSSLAVTMPSFG